MRRVPTVALLTISLGFALATEARANTIVQTDSIFTYTFFRNDGYGFSQPVATGGATFSLFDPSLGTLTGVDFVLSFFYSGSVTARNQDPFGNLVSGTIQATAVIVYQLETPTYTYYYPQNHSTSFLSDGSSVQESSQSFSHSALESLFAPTAPYVGIGTFDVDVESRLAIAANAFGAASNAAQANLKLTYSFDPPGPGTKPVPEPSSLALFALAMAGAGAARRRTRPQA